MLNITFSNIWRIRLTYAAFVTFMLITLTIIYTDFWQSHVKMDNRITSRSSCPVHHTPLVIEQTLKRYSFTSQLPSDYWQARQRFFPFDGMLPGIISPPPNWIRQQVCAQCKKAMHEWIKQPDWPINNEKEEARNRWRKRFPDRAKTVQLTPFPEGKR